MDFLNEKNLSLEHDWIETGAPMIRETAKRIENKRLSFPVVIRDDWQLTFLTTILLKESSKRDSNVSLSGYMSDAETERLPALCSLMEDLPSQGMPLRDWATVPGWGKQVSGPSCLSVWWFPCWFLLAALMCDCCHGPGFM